MSNTTNTTIHNFICHSQNQAAIKGCCTGTGTLFSTVTANQTINIAFCAVPPSEPKVGAAFVNCVTKAFGLSDPYSLVPGSNEANSIACAGPLPAASSAQTTMTSTKWAAVALVAVFASTVVAL